MADQGGPPDDLVLFRQIKAGLSEDDMGDPFLFEEITGLGGVLQTGITLGSAAILVISLTNTTTLNSIHQQGV